MKDKNETMKILISPGELDDDFNRESDLETLVNYNLELVDHPAHYNHGGYEAIDVIEAWNLDFHCGNALKYISRHKYKGQPKKDIQKAIWYLQRYLEKMQ